MNVYAAMLYGWVGGCVCVCVCVCMCVYVCVWRVVRGVFASGHQPSKRWVLKQARTEELLPVECGVRDSSSGSEVLRSGPGQHQDSVQDDAYTAIRRLPARGSAPFRFPLLIESRSEHAFRGARAWYDPGTLLFSSLPRTYALDPALFPTPTPVDPSDRLSLRPRKHLWSADTNHRWNRVKLEGMCEFWITWLGAALAAAGLHASSSSFFPSRASCLFSPFPYALNFANDERRLSLGSDWSSVNYTNDDLCLLLTLSAAKLKRGALCWCGYCRVTWFGSFVCHDRWCFFFCQFPFFSFIPKRRVERRSLLENCYCWIEVQTSPLWLLADVARCWEIWVDRRLVFWRHWEYLETWQINFWA